MTTPHDRLADWILCLKPDTSHLKLQKLVFYCFGIVASKSAFRAELGEIEFRAWKHGPVNTELYYRFCDSGPSLQYQQAQVYSQDLAKSLHDVLAVYGRLSPWEIRNQSHLEAPWSETPQSEVIPTEKILTHFAQKFAPGKVRAPEYVGGGWSLALDGIPLSYYASFEALAQRLR